MHRPKKAAKLMDRQKELMINIKEKIEVIKGRRKNGKDRQNRTGRRRDRKN